MSDSSMSSGNNSMSSRSSNNRSNESGSLNGSSLDGTVNDNSGNSNNRTLERVKTLLIIILLASSLALGWQTGLFSELSAYLPLFGGTSGFRDTTGLAEKGSTVKKEAARPLYIVISNENGERCAVKYNTEMRNNMYERTSSIFSEALGSVSQLSEVSEDEWCAALSGQGIFYEYPTPVRLSILNGWLGAHKADDDYGNRMTKRIFVAFGEDRSRVYFQDAETNLFFGADTASTSGKAQELGVFAANDAMFAYEISELLAVNAPFSIITNDSTHPVVLASQAGNTDEILGLTLEAAGHGNENNAIIYDTDKLVCIGTQFRITVDRLGQAIYRRTEGWEAGIEPGVYSFSNSEYNESELIELGRIFISETIAAKCGGAEVFYESSEMSEDGAYTVFFGYYIAGGRVHLFEDGHAAKITFIKGNIIEAELRFRAFTATEETIRLIPERQTLAAAGGEYLLNYSDSGFELLTPEWIRMDMRDE